MKYLAIALLTLSTAMFYVAWHEDEQSLQSLAHRLAICHEVNQELRSGVAPTEHARCQE